MSDATEVVKDTVSQLLERMDAVAAKLGIAAEQIWKFTVTAKVVNAKRDLAKAGIPILVALCLWGWSAHVALTKIPHDVKHYQESRVQYEWKPCEQIVNLNGKAVITHQQCQLPFGEKPESREVDEGISQLGYALIGSGIFCFLFGLVFIATGAEKAIDSVAAAKTAEYDAYQDLVSDWL